MAKSRYGRSSGPMEARTTDALSIVFSKDRRHVAFVTRGGEKRRVVLDGQQGPEYDRIGTLIFQPNGTRLAYVAGTVGNVLWSSMARLAPHMTA